VVLFATPLWYANASHFRDMVEGALGRADTPIRVLVIDTIGMSDLDFTGTRTLARVLDRCARDDIEIGFARTGEHVQRSLRRSGLMDRIGEDHFFPAVNEAVSALAPGPSATS
jgi:MFS superfamily sulfate permease-like transporter